MSPPVPGPTIEAVESLDFDAGNFDHEAHHPTFLKQWLKKYY